MSYANLAVGAILVAGALQLAVTTVVPDTRPIVVHSLNYVDGMIHQHRTVTTETGGFFPAQWRAFLVDADTKKAVEECSGAGFWPYESGTITAEMSLARWTGNEGCTVEFLRELGGEYCPVASWHWGNDSTSKQGDCFRP